MAKPRRMAKNKLQRYAEIQSLPNVFEHTELIKCSWRPGYFPSPAPVILELACGKGDYTLALARNSKQIIDKPFNYIGVDVKGSRIWKGAKQAISENLTNVAFIRTYIQFLPEIFPAGSISEIWITFPDPYLSTKKSNKRLTSPFFLGVYSKILAPGGKVHLKTDSNPLFNFTIKTLESENCKIHRLIPDVHGDPDAGELLRIQTYYEKKHLANRLKIKYVCFSLPNPFGRDVRTPVFHQNSEGPPDAPSERGSREQLK
ncbi:MAG: tRNA (guanosine(46)-N7)-methyltransferase TrmB [Planctomycetota bacterium]